MQQRLEDVRRPLARLRQFILEGDTSAKVRAWLAEAEQEEARLQCALADIGAKADHRPVEVHPGRVKRYLDDLRGTLARGDAKVRELLRLDVERIVIHPVRPETGKPFARAEVVTAGKGLLGRVALMVAGAGFAECYTPPETHWIDLR